MGADGAKHSHPSAKAGAPTPSHRKVDGLREFPREPVGTQTQVPKPGHLHPQQACAPFVIWPPREASSFHNSRVEQKQN